MRGRRSPATRSPPPAGKATPAWCASCRPAWGPRRVPWCWPWAAGGSWPGWRLACWRWAGSTCPSSPWRPAGRTASTRRWRPAGWSRCRTSPGGLGRGLWVSTRGGRDPQKGPAVTGVPIVKGHTGVQPPQYTEQAPAGLQRCKRGREYADTQFARSTESGPRVSSSCILNVFREGTQGLAPTGCAPLS